ncbi:MAG: hypothetical protein ACK5NK_04100 [Niabella sp.]
MYIKYSLFIIIILLSTLQTGAQEFGGNPFSIRWRQINTDTTRIIFPKGLDSTAMRIAGVVHRTAAKNPFSLGNKIKKIDIVLQNQTIYPNGYVSLGPYRSEFYLTPPSDNFDMGALPWQDQLALHEYRHVQQFNNFNNGVSKLMHNLFGGEGYALAINAAIPNWFFEGDAVFAETILSKQGRGRLPSFLKAYPALWEAGKKYSWMKLRNGSYKDYIPNHYELGYLLVNYGYEKYGTDFWKNVTRDASSYKGVFYPMQKAVKKYAGIPYTKFTSQAMEYYKKLYKADSHTITTPNNKYVTNRVFPQYISPDSVVFLKTSYTQRPAFVLQHNGKEQLLRYRDISMDEQFSYKNGRIIYAAIEQHPRWQWKNYSVLKVYNINTGQQFTVKKRTRYFSPDISADGKTIITARVSLNGQASLEVLNASNGKILQQISASDIHYFGNPKFISSNEVAAAIRLKNSKSFVGVINLTTKQISAITPPSYITVGYISTYDSMLYFTASQELKDEIFSINLRNKEIKKLITEDLTNYYPTANNNKISFSQFTAHGYQLKEINNSGQLWEKTNFEKFTNASTGIISKKYTTGVDSIDSVSKSNFTVQPYAKLTRPFNFHSWRPNYEDPIFSFTIYGNNVLNTVVSQLQYSYNQNDRTHAVDGAMVYGGLFPYLSIGSKYTFNRRAVVSQKRLEWNQWDNYAGIQIPLNWISRKTYKYFNGGSIYSYRTDFSKGIYKDSFRTTRFGYLYYHLTWGQELQTPRMFIFPQWGYNINMQFRHAVNLYKGWQYYAKLNLFTPGILPTHSINITAAIQEAGLKDRIFSNRFPFARGFNAIDSARIYGATFNYHFPITYPDWGFANIFYLRRIRTGLFYDITSFTGKTTLNRGFISSTGADLFFDTKWWNQHPITLGLRGGYLLQPDPVTKKQGFFFEFILPVSIIPK